LFIFKPLVENDYTHVLKIALTIPFPFSAQVRRAFKSACLAKLEDAKQSRLARGHGSGLGISVPVVEWESPVHEISPQRLCFKEGKPGKDGTEAGQT
jgi:hypothetical protein